MKGELNKALKDSFDRHEEHREALAAARVSHRRARDADERVRQLRRLERERVSRRTGKGRAA